MSNKSESFEEWFKSTFPDVYRSNPYEKRAMAAWNHQQKKIDELESQLDTKFKTPPIVFALEEKLQAAEERERILREAVELIDGYPDKIDIMGIFKVARQAIEKVKRGG